MVGTIAPLVQRQRRQWIVSATAFSAAGSLSGGLAGTALAVVGRATQPLHYHSAHFVLPIIAVLVALLELRLVPLPLPTIHQSVPQAWWIRFGPTRGSLAYGAVLGLGVTTVIPFAGFYLILVAAFLAGLPGGTVIGFAYGLARTLPVWVASLPMATGRNPVVVGRWIMAQRQIAKSACGAAVVSFAIVSVSLASH